MLYFLKFVCLHLKEGYVINTFWETCSFPVCFWWCFKGHYFAISLNFIFIKSVIFIIGSEKVETGNTFFFSPLIVMRCLCTPGHGRRLFATRIILNILLQNFLSMMVCLLAVSSFAFASLVVWKNLKMAFMFLGYRHGDFKCACFLCIWWSPLFLFQGIV